MDFASLMSKEIAKAKGTGTSSSSSTTKKEPTTTPAPKYISRREAEEARQAAYLASQKALEAERAAKAAAKRKREEEAAAETRLREEKRQKLAEESRLRREAAAAEEEKARRRRLGLPEIPPTQQSEDDDDDNKSKDKDEQDDDLDEDDDELVKEAKNLSETDLISRLRALGEPSSLFGETHPARLRRYLRAARPESTSNGPISTTLRSLPEERMAVPATPPPPTDKKARRYLYRQLSSYFNMVLREWELALAREDNADTTAGRAALAAMVSSKENMRPLFRKFETGDLDETVFEAVVEIVHAAQSRRYVDANDGYLRLSIGKAAWPIGVTMVGIHERSAREKLHAGEKGHIMRSEVTRKYLQSIKRCLTFAQVRWPPEDIRQLMG